MRLSYERATAMDKEGSVLLRTSWKKHVTLFHQCYNYLPVPYLRLLLSVWNPWYFQAVLPACWAVVTSEKAQSRKQ